MEASCAVCKSNASTVLFDICNVVAPSTRWKHGTRYVFMLLLSSVSPAVLSGNGAVLYFVKVESGAIKCPPYVMTKC